MAGGNERGLGVVDDPARDAPDNMAIDEALLASDAGPTLRLYGWEPAAISIGRFQRLADFEDAPARTLVRRVTGGGAIHHDRELTFALVCDLDVLPSGLDESYRLVHGAIADALNHVGVSTQRFGRGAVSPRPTELWCFEQPTCHDLVTSRGKIVGSAQRRTGGPRPRVLHHGTIVLESPAATPDCGAVAEFADPDTVLPVLRTQIAERLASALGLRPERSTTSLTASALQLARAAVIARRSIR